MKALLAEATGTALLVMLGCGAIMTEASFHTVGGLGVALTFGSAVALAVLLFRGASGAHINPAMTLALAATGRFPWRNVPGYVAAQSTGAVVGAATLLLLLGPIADLGTTHLAAGLGPWKGFGIEVLATLLLAFAVARSECMRPYVLPLAAGGAVALDALVAGPWTGASMNPARSLGPALVSGATGDLALYIAAPVLGALLGFALHDVLYRRPPASASTASQVEAHDHPHDDGHAHAQGEVEHDA